MKKLVKLLNPPEENYDKLTILKKIMDSNNLNYDNNGLDEGKKLSDSLLNGETVELNSELIEDFINEDALIFEII